MDGQKKLLEALQFFRGVFELLPDPLSGYSRLDRCLAAMRERVENSTFGQITRPTAQAKKAAMGDPWVPVTYPVHEANRLIASSRNAILQIVPMVEMEPGLRARLIDELKREGDYFEDDPRGTIDDFINPTGPTSEKMRNNGRVDAMIAFLHGLRGQPYAVILTAIQALSEVDVPPEILSVSVEKEELMFRGTRYEPGIEACLFVDMLLRARRDGVRVSFGQVKARLVAMDYPVTQLRPDRVKQKLPLLLRDAIETTQQGSRLLVERLMSQV